MVFGMVGGHVSAVFDGLAAAGIRAVCFRDERSAALGAAAFGALTRFPGVCVLTAGPGLTNGITGLAQGHLAGWPLVSVVGRFETPREGMGALQEVGQESLLAPISKRVVTVRDPMQIEGAVAAALEQCLTTPQGHVSVMIPVDVLSQLVPQTPQVQPPPAIAASGLSAEATGAIIDLIKHATAPALIVGPNCWVTGADEALATLLQKVQLPTFTYDEARGLISDDHPLALGDILYGQSGATKLLREADLVIAVGSVPDWRVSFLSPPQIAAEAAVVQIDSRLDSLRPLPNSRVRACADERAALTTLAELAPELSWPHWIERIQEERRRYRQKRLLEAAPAGDGVHPLRLVITLSEFVDEVDANVVIDGGHIGKWAKMVLKARRPGQLCRLKGPFAAIGHGLISAMVRRLTDPGRHTVLITGDGSFGYTVMELETAQRESAPVIAVVAVDGAWGSVLTPQVATYGTDYGAMLPLTRFDLIARAMGLDGIWVEDEVALASALRTAPKDRTTVIAVRTATVTPPARYSAGIGY
jgi:acetolactate synthase-1/2/3 large subunit